MESSRQHITLEEFMQCPEFAHLSEEMAQKMLSSIREFCLLVSEHEICSEIRKDIIDDDLN